MFSRAPDTLPQMTAAPANPLHALHQQADAEFQNYGDVEIVCTFGEPQAEYSAIRKGCGLIDLPQRGILRLEGKDRLDFLNRFLTNELIGKETKKPLAPGEGVYAFLLNNKGRIVADMNVLERGDHTLLESDARNITEIHSVLGKYIFSEQVTFKPQIGQLHEMALHGLRSAEILKQLGIDVSPLGSIQSLQGQLAGEPILIWRDDPAGVPGYHLITAADSTAKIWMHILSRFSAPDPTAEQNAKRQVWPVGWAAFNSTRIEAGRALFGIDFDNTVLPAETSQLSRAVSFTKGCYLGQEIVARMHARNQVARQIVGIRMNEDALPIAGSPIYDQGQNQVGAVTSSTMSPVLSNAAICLAMVKQSFASIGATVRVAAEGAVRPGVVTELPFLPPFKG